MNLEDADRPERAESESSSAMVQACLQGRGAAGEAAHAVVDPEDGVTRPTVPAGAVDTAVLKDT